MFTLYEELCLLCVHEGKGTFIDSSTDPLRIGVGGAILTELALLGKIQTSDNHRLLFSEDSKTNIDILDAALSAVMVSDKERKFSYWIGNLGQGKEKFHKQSIENLIQKGVFTHEDDRLNWITPSPLQADIKASTKYWVVKRLRSVVLAGEDIQPRDIILLSLLRACGLLDLVFLRDERKIASRAINQLFYGQALKDPVFQTIQEIDAAIAELVEED